PRTLLLQLINWLKYWKRPDFQKAYSISFLVTQQKSVITLWTIKIHISSISLVPVQLGHASIIVRLSYMKGKHTLNVLLLKWAVRMPSLLITMPILTLLHNRLLIQHLASRGKNVPHVPVPLSIEMCMMKYWKKQLKKQKYIPLVTQLKIMYLWVQLSIKNNLIKSKITWKSAKKKELLSMVVKQMTPKGIMFTQPSSKTWILREPSCKRKYSDLLSDFPKQRTLMNFLTLPITQTMH